MKIRIFSVNNALSKRKRIKMKKTELISQDIMSLINEWEPVLAGLSVDTITLRKNSQNRTIKQIVGHLVDSASNNTHRIVHLQYQSSPLIFPNYATEGNNDKWIAIQDYQNEDWQTLIQLWKFSMLHISHVINNVDPEKMNNEWIAGPDKKVSLEGMITDFPPHFRLHLSEINKLINNS
jgi:hypothetical protein